jgi:hypothetical protein
VYVVRSNYECIVNLVSIEPWMAYKVGEGAALATSAVRLHPNIRIEFKQLAD